MHIVFTGRAVDATGAFHERRELAQACSEMGWSTSDTVTSLTTALVAGEDELAHPTKKVRDARRAFIPVQPYSWFFTQLQAQRRTIEDHARATRRGVTLEAAASRVERTEMVEVTHLDPSTMRTWTTQERRVVPDRLLERAPRRNRSDEIETPRGRRMVGEAYRPFSGSELRDRIGLPEMEMDFITMWADRLGMTIEWTPFGSSGAMFRVSCGRVEQSDMTLEQVREQVAQKRTLWLAKHEPEPVVFGKRTRKMLL